MADDNEFDERFRWLTGNPPFPWQRALYRRFLGDGRIPASCDLPTGLGKTSVIAIWLLALAERARAGGVDGFPRRLLYVVNRRTVVDQATQEAEHLREALLSPALSSVRDALRGLAARPTETPIAISTLRGQFADNAEWRSDPARPAIVVGTVDLIGSGLLFSAYRSGFRSRPLHAGFLGQDAILVHDEAHLEPAFQALITEIVEEQTRCGDPRPLKVMALTATSRGGGERFSLGDDDLRNETVLRRIRARKGLALVAIENDKKTADEVARLALEHRHGAGAILIFLRRLEDVEKVSDRLRRETPNVQVLTGTMRGLERDRLAREDAVFARFFRKSKAEPKPGCVYLVCTSAGEVGVDLSADHLICDLTPFDSMAQRLGRVNRFGDGDARVDVVCALSPASDDDLEERRRRTLALLEKLPLRDDGRRDASPAALASLPAAEREAAFTPEPERLPVSDVLFDAWAMTSIRESLPGRPPVEDWLHGVRAWEPPETSVAWREEVERVGEDMQQAYPPEELLDDYPLKPHELLSDRTDRVLGHLEKLAQRHPGATVWLVAKDLSLEQPPLRLAELCAAGKEALAGRIVVLPPSVGGLAKTGLLDGTVEPRARPEEADGAGDGSEGAQDVELDVADWVKDDAGLPRRLRVWDDAPAPKGMRLVRTIDLLLGDDDGSPDSSRRFWHWYVRPRTADEIGPKTGITPQELAPHLVSAADFARAIVARLGLPEREATAVVGAARWHDLGKRRAAWQRSVRNGDYPARVLAKGKMSPRTLGGYRHELGSLVDVVDEEEFDGLPPDTRDIVLHLIATHHGRARPHFPEAESCDPERPAEQVAAIVREVPRRFARLQRRYGRWGLAYLESLVRAADVLASQELDAREEAAAAAPAREAMQ